MSDINLDENETQIQPTQEPIFEQPAELSEEAKNETIEIKKLHLSLREKVTNFFNNPKKRLIFICSIGALIIALFAVGLYFLLHENKTTNSTANTEINLNTNTTTNSETLYTAPLDGTLVSKEIADRHPLGIMVENHPDARPQSGLSKASIVYEVIVEGGITRFMAVYGTYEADTVGPVRSARPYYVDWIHGYSGYYAHVGGSTQALDKISAENIYDINQFAFPDAFWRDKNANVALEHTMFASTPKLRITASENRYPTINSFTVYKFKDDSAKVNADAAPVEQKISINYGSPTYNVYFKYDKESNSYKRYLAQSPQIDQTTKTQLSPKNVIIMTVERKSIVVKAGTDGWQMTTVGSNNASFFIDGVETKGTWTKASTSDREMFYDATGKEMQFNRGQTWISVISPDVTPIVE